MIKTTRNKWSNLHKWNSNLLGNHCSLFKISRVASSDSNSSKL